MGELSTPMTIDERFELVCRLIDRYDNLLTSIESRAAIVVSADALLLTGATFLIDKVLSYASQYSLTKQVFLGANISLTLLTLTLSLIYAITGIVTVWRSSRAITGRDTPRPNLFFRSGDTAEFFKGFTDFENNFRSSTKEQMLTYALGELWLITNLNVHRYQSLRRAIRLLLISIFPFLVSFAILTIR
jgi:hypothetical protein